jgi:isoleucyl-tRNA synthetase
VLTVALDVSLTPELEMEGNARELVNRIQKIRKDLNLELTDRIIVEIQSDSELDPAFTQFNPYICAEILATEMLFVAGDLLNKERVEINEKEVYISIEKDS